MTSIVFWRWKRESLVNRRSLQYSWSRYFPLGITWVAVTLPSISKAENLSPPWWKTKTLNLEATRGKVWGNESLPVLKLRRRILLLPRERRWERVSRYRGRERGREDDNNGETSAKNSTPTLTAHCSVSLCLLYREVIALPPRVASCETFPSDQCTVVTRPKEHCLDTLRPFLPQLDTRWGVLEAQKCRK